MDPFPAGLCSDGFAVGCVRSPDEVAAGNVIGPYSSEFDDSNEGPDETCLTIAVACSIHKQILKMGGLGKAFMAE